MSLVNGLDLVFYSGKYDPFLIKKTIDNLHIEVMCGTPTIFNQLSRLYRGAEVNRTILKMALSGECLSKKIAANIRKAFPKAEIYNIYGLTENSPRVSFLPPSKFDEFPESVGIGLVDTIIRIVDDNGDDVEKGKPGHVVVKSKSVGEDAGSGGKEKIICVLEKLEPKQTSKIQDILKILSELCEVI